MNKSKIGKSVLAAALTAVFCLPHAAAYPREQSPEINPYGYIKMDIAYDSARTAFGDISFWVLPAGAAGGKEKELTFSSRETRLGANIIGPRINGLKTAGRIEADLYEEIGSPGKHTPRLRLAYFDLAWGEGWSVRIGQDWDAYVNLWTSTVDFSWLGYAGHLYGRRPQARIEKIKELGGSASLAGRLALAHGRSQDADGDGQQDADAAGIPQVQGKIELKTKLLTDKPSSLTLAGVYAREKLGEGPGEGSYDSTLAIAGLRLPITKNFTIQGEVWSGKNVDAYLGGIGQGINPSEAKEVKARGGWAQGIYQLSRRWSAGIGYGLDDPDDGGLSGDARTRNTRVFGNLFYTPLDNVTFSIELSQMKTEYAVSESAENNRVHFGAKYAF